MQYIPFARCVSRIYTFICVYICAHTQGVPPSLRMLVLGEFPAWVKLGSWGMIGAAAAALVLLVSKYISVSVSVSLR